MAQDLRQGEAVGLSCVGRHHFPGDHVGNIVCHLGTQRGERGIPSDTGLYGSEGVELAGEDFFVLPE